MYVKRADTHSYCTDLPALGWIKNNLCMCAGRAGRFRCDVNLLATHRTHPMLIAHFGTSALGPIEYLCMVVLHGTLISVIVVAHNIIIICR